jgi:hypothetical protein
MSLCDVWITPAKALVVVDTEVAHYEGNGLRFEASKFMFLPHANVIVAVRGTTLYLNGLHSVMHGLPHGSFDAYVEALPTVLPQVSAMIQMQLRAAAYPAEVLAIQHQQQVALVGYSSARREMLCLLYESKDESGFGEPDCGDGDSFYAPWKASWGEPIDVKTPEHARIMATEQVARALQELPDSAHGGRLLLAELTRDDCRMSTLARLTERAER